MSSRKGITALTILAALALSAWTAAQDRSTLKPPKHHTYQFIDLGTFGGPSSAINESVNGGPLINARGDVVGSAQTTTPLSGVSNLFECWPGPNVNHALLWQGGHSFDLGALPPADTNCSGQNSIAINDAGDIAVQSETGTIDPSLGVKEVRSVLLRRGHVIDLGSLGGNATIAGGINNRGEVVGFALNSVPDPYSIYGLFFEGSSNSTQTRAFAWRNGALQDLGTLGGPDAGSNFVNDAGQVIGFSYVNSIPNETTGLPTLNPFSWERGKMTDIGNFGGNFSLPNRMNNRGQVVGQSNLAGDLTFHAFFWERGVLRDLGTLGGSTSQANSINEAGDAVGVADLPGDATHDAVLWNNGRKIDLGNLGLTSFAYDINNGGQVVGASRLADGTTVRAFLWENGGPMVDLNDLISQPSSLAVAYAKVINNSGIIAGNAIPAGCNGSDRCMHAFVLIPEGDCDRDCEQRLDDHERERAAAAQLARAQGRIPHPEPWLTPAERVRNIMQQRFGLSGSHPTLRD